MPHNLYAIHHILDANINRFKEGARVLEDIARFILKDESLFQKIKKCKNAIRIDKIYRESGTDIGGPSFKEDNYRERLTDIIHANAIRMQEAARVLEEFTGDVFYKNLRFESYDIHQLIIDGYKKYHNMQRLNGLYLICNPSIHDYCTIQKTLSKNNIKICQLRSKQIKKKRLIQHAKTLYNVCNEQSCLFIVNDHIDVALAYGDGLHIGQDDFCLKEARRILPDKFIVGVTCRTIEQAVQAEHNGATYISVGCIFNSQTKLNAKPTSLSTLNSIVKSVSIPVCAIGGINPKNMDTVLSQGVDMVAMCKGII